MDQVHFKKMLLPPPWHCLKSTLWLERRMDIPNFDGLLFVMAFKLKGQRLK